MTCLWREANKLHGLKWEYHNAPTSTTTKKKDISPIVSVEKKSLIYKLSLSLRSYFNNKQFEDV